MAKLLLLVLAALTFSWPIPTFLKGEEYFSYEAIVGAKKELKQKVPMYVQFQAGLEESEPKLVEATEFVHGKELQVFLKHSEILKSLMKYFSEKQETRKSNFFEFFTMHEGIGAYGDLSRPRSSSESVSREASSKEASPVRTKTESEVPPIKATAEGIKAEEAFVRLTLANEEEYTSYHSEKSDEKTRHTKPSI